MRNLLGDSDYIGDGDRWSCLGDGHGDWSILVLRRSIVLTCWVVGG